MNTHIPLKLNVKVKSNESHKSKNNTSPAAAARNAKRKNRENDTIVIAESSVSRKQHNNPNVLKKKETISLTEESSQASKKVAKLEAAAANGTSLNLERESKVKVNGMQKTLKSSASNDTSDLTESDVPATATLPFRKTLVEGEPGTMTGRPLRLYADGIFDLFHFGHAMALKQCKVAYPNTFLLVGCCSDELTHALKGRTVMSEYERYESLRHCKWVDQVVENAPWVLDDEFLETHEIDYVCHDALPYGDASGESDEGDVYARIKRMGKFLETQRTTGISTSDLIIRIISQYDTFIRRNLTRGYTGKEMNVPFIKEQSIKWDMAVEKLKTKTKELTQEVKEKGKGVVHDADSMFHSWVDKAEDLQDHFLDLFSRDGVIRTSLRNRRRLIKDKISDFAREGKC